MIRPTPFPVGLIFLSLLGTARADDVEIVSTFDSDLERWQAEGGELSHLSRGDEKCLQITDTASQHSMAVLAPERFIGDLSRFDGGALRFDAREIAIPTRGPWSAFGAVTIDGGRGEARADLSPRQATKTWTTYSIRLVASDWDVDTSAWRAILSDVKTIRVTLESCCVSGETVGFDNFRLTTRPEVIASQGFHGCDKHEDNPLIHSNVTHRQGIKHAARGLADAAHENLRHLEEALRYNNETVRWAAQDALVSLGEYAVPVLTRVLQTGDRRAKEHACNALQRMGPAASSAIPLLLRSLESDASTANYAARALSTVGKGSRLARDGLRKALAAGEIRSAGAIESTLRTIEESLKRTAERTAGSDVEDCVPDP